MLPAAASFKKQGANRGALASFLISTPESGVDSIAITYALLDPIMTVARPLAAFVTGISAGFIENSISSEFIEDGTSPESDSAGNQTSPTVTGATDWKQRLAQFREGLQYGFTEVWGDIVLWFFVGLLLAGIIAVYLPEELSLLVLGGGIVSMLAMLLMGMPIYICATASTPIAAALLLKGASPGAVLVFLLVGPATNMTSLSVLFKILGKAGTMRYLLVIATVSVLFGLGLDRLYHYLAIEPRAVISEVRELVPYWLKLSSALILIVLSGVHFYRRYRLHKLRNGKNQYIADFPALGSPLPHGQKHVPALVKHRDNKISGKDQ